MATIDELRALAREIREERQIGGNTGARVGNTFDKVADLLESTGGDISDIREAVEQLLQDVGFIPRDISRTATDAVFTNSEGELLFWLRAATDTLAGLITAANNNKLIALPTAEELAQALAAKQNRLTFDPRPIEGSTNPVTSDGINTAIANFVTRSVSDLIYYYTKSETYTKEEVNALVAAIKQFVPVVAQTLPTPSADTMYKLYLIPSEDPQEGNIKDEYITIDNGASANPRYTWEKIGSVDIDISGKADIGTVPADVTRTQTDATFVNNNHEPLFYLRQATSSLAGLMTSAEHNKLDSLPDAQTLNTSIESIIYDVSANHPTAGPNSDGKFTLAYILNPSNVNTLIPIAVRKGGMSIKFVQTSDNKYVQYRLMSDTFSTTVTDWQGVDDEPTAGSNNLVKSGGVEAEFEKCSKFPYTTSYKPYLSKRLKELYLTGLNSEHTYFVGQLYSNSGTAVLRIYDSADDTEVARADIHTLKGLSVISERNNSGISGYAVVNIDSTDTSGSSLHLDLVNNIVSNIDFSPTIKASLTSFNTGQKLTDTKIINDTTTGGVNDVTSAEVAKNLNKDIKDLTQELYKLVLSYPTIRIFQVRVDNAATNATYETAGDGMGTFPVSKGDIVEFTANSDYAGEIGLLQNLDNVANGNLVPFMTGTSLIAVAKGVKETVIVPDEGYFFFNRSTNASRDGRPSALVIKKLVSKTQTYLQDCADYKVLAAGRNTTSTSSIVQIIYLTTIPTIPNGSKYKVIVSGLPDTDKIKFYLNGSSSAQASVGNGEHEFTATSDITQFNVKSARSETSVESDVEVKLVIDDIKAIIKNNKDDIQQIKNSTMPKIGIEDLQSAAGVSGNDFTENFAVYVDSALFKTSNSIFSCTAKYTTSDAGIVPTLRFSYGNSAGTTFRQKYIIGTKDEFEEKQWRFPKMVGYNIIRIEFLIPTGVTLTIKDFSVALDNSVNRDTFRFFEHSINPTIGEFNTIGAFTYATQMGYYGAIIVPKFTSDGVIVCYHDDSFGDNPDVEMIDGTELPTTSIETSTYAQVCGMQYVSTNRLGEHPRIPTFETFIKICAKTGVHPCLSCHPYIDENGWRAIKSITDKYHVTDKLTIKHTPVVGSTNYQTIIHNVFGDGIECYLPDVSTDNLSSIITQFGSVNWDLDKVKVGVEFMNPTYAANALARETGGINDLVAAGYVWGVFENVPDATTLKTLIDAGCYEWTISDFYSSGLNW